MTSRNSLEKPGIREILARRIPRRSWVHVLVALGAAFAILAPVLIVHPDAMKRGHQEFWVPIVAGTGLAIWIAAFVTERVVRQRLPVFTALLVGAAVAAVTLEAARPAYRAATGRKIRAWSLFHYYLGSKYFAELGYRDLYAATLAADEDWQSAKRAAPPSERERLDAIPDFRGVTAARDMRTYRTMPRHVLANAFDRRRFTPERWRSFGEDTRWIRARLGDESLQGMMTDLGNNVAPPWLVIGVPLSNLAPLGSPLFLLLVNLDTAILAILALALARGFGPRAAAAGVLFLAASHFDEGRLVGGLLQYDWLLATVLGVTLYETGRPAASGAALAFAAMTRVFPGLLVLPIAARTAWSVLRGAPSTDPAGRGLLARVERRRARFLAAFAAACALLALLACFTGRGPAAWSEWASKMALHAQLHPASSEQRIGAGRLALLEPRDGDWLAARRGSWKTVVEETSFRRLAFLAAGLLLLVPALIRRSDTDATILMLFAVFLAVTVSRYYAAAWILLFGLGPPDTEGRASWPAFLAGAFLLGMTAWFRLPGDVREAAYMLANIEALAMFVAVCVVYLGSDVREMVRRRAATAPRTRNRTWP